MIREITAISVQKKNPKRVNIYLDGEFAFGLSRITAAWLTVGQEITSEKISLLKSEDEIETAYQKSINYISYQPRTEQEVRQKLESNSYSNEIIDITVGKLLSIGLIDDQKFAKDWVDNRFEFRPRSKRALFYELRRRGIPTDYIEAATEDVDDSVMAFKAASKQAHKYRTCDWKEFRKKMLGFLSRRGFNYEICAHTIKRTWDECILENKIYENEADI
jgi:regulatory protein